jgi:phage terminase large subunit-like protein
VTYLTEQERFELAQVIYNWDLVARDKQKLPLGDWQTWLILAGRGFGKTRCGCETVRQWKNNNPLIILAGATAGDVRDIMIEGESGMLAISPPWDKPVYSSSLRRLTWSNGSKAILVSADEPDRFRGLQCYKAWADELASWRYPEAWDQLMFGLRLGNNPQVVVTTTPRPTQIIKSLIKDYSTHVTKGTSYENQQNLAPTFFSNIIKKYEGTRLGRQELNAEILEDVEGALWKTSLIEMNRVQLMPQLKRIVVALDPAVTSNKTSDEFGIVVTGLGVDGLGYVLEDLTGIYSPKEWSEKAINAYQRWTADRIIGEANNGGELIRAVLEQVDRNVSYKDVYASKGKVTRAEPIVALYEQGKVKHVGTFAKLEDEMTTWDAKINSISPGRIDALVWGLSELMITQEESHILLIKGV